jgi:hypothetical protein
MVDDLVRLDEFLVNAYIRPTDIINHMQHRYVDIVRGQHTYLRL